MREFDDYDVAYQQAQMFACGMLRDKDAPERDYAVVDVDSTLTPTFGRRQEGFRVQLSLSKGYHLPIAIDTPRREVIGIRLQKGAEYCSRGSGGFAGAVLDASTDCAGRSIPGPEARFSVAPVGSAVFASHDDEYGTRSRRRRRDLPRRRMTPTCGSARELGAACL